MTVNRVLQYLGGDCQCRRAHRIVSRWEAAADVIEAADAELLECIVPSILSVMDGDEPSIKLWLRVEPEPLTDLSTAVDEAARELRRFGSRMIAAADRLDRGKGVQNV